MTSTLIESILVMLAHATVGIYSSALKYSKKTTFLIWGVWVVVQCAILWFAEFVLSVTAVQFLLGFVLTIIGQYIIYFVTTRGRFAQRVFTMLTYSIFFCIMMTLFSMVKGTFTQMHPVVAIFMQALMLAGLVYYFLFRVCPLCSAAEKSIGNGWLRLISVNIIFMVTVILSSVFPVKLNSFSDPTCVTFIFLSISIVAVYPVVFSNINSMSEAATKREVERQNKLLLAQIEAENVQLAADSQARHDRRHHNLVMLEYANNNDIENVREYLRNLVESESQVWGEERYCDHMTVNTVLTVYGHRAEERGICVDISASVSRDLAVLPQDLVIVIANLFENAINAVSKLKAGGKYIKISIKESTQRLLIRVENPCREKLIFDESFYGVGIHSVIATTNKYDGMFDFAVEDGIFSAKISLNLQ